MSYKVSLISKNRYKYIQFNLKNLKMFIIFDNLGATGNGGQYVFLFRSCKFIVFLKKSL
jgi:hypothetical protein